jgi:hypothetical protein
MFKELRNKLLKVYLASDERAKGMGFGRWLEMQDQTRGEWYEEAYVFIRYIGGDYE